MATSAEKKTRPAGGLLTTKEVAGKVGIAAATLRAWKRQGLVKPVVARRRGDRWQLDSVRKVAQDIEANRKGGRLRGIPAASQATTVVNAVLATAASAARASGDTAVSRWLTRLLERGDRASGTAAATRHEKRQQA